MKYIELYTALRKSIENGSFTYGEKLPSKRTLSDKFSVSVITVVHALELLCDEGYIMPRQRSGYFVIYRKGEHKLIPLLHQTVPTKRDFVKIDGFPFSSFAKTMRKVLTCYGEEILSRSQKFGNLELRNEISRYLARAKGMNVPCERIVIGAGAEYLYELSILFFGKSTVFAIENPSYMQIEKIYRANEIEIELLPLGNDGIESSYLKKTSATVLHISPFRSYPSGVTASATKRLEYVEWLKKGNRYIIEDDFESEFSKNPSQSLYSLTEGKGIIYINTFSKTISPSLRVAYMVLPEEISTEFEKKLGFFSCTVPTFEQLVIAEFIKTGDFERHINKIRRNSKKIIDKEK